MALYLQHLLEQAQSPSVIDSAFYGIKWAHDMAGVPSPTDNSVVENVRSAAKRILGTAAVNRKEPISSDLIREIVSQANLDNPVDLRNITIAMAAGSLLRRRTCMLMIASSKGSQFLSVWVCNCFPCAQYFVTLARLGWFLPGPPQINLFAY